jgi:hypothetical protein
VDSAHARTTRGARCACRKAPGTLPQRSRGTVARTPGVSPVWQLGRRRCWALASPHGVPRYPVGGAAPGLKQAAKIGQTCLHGAYPGATSAQQRWRFAGCFESNRGASPLAAMRPSRLLDAVPVWPGWGPRVGQVAWKISLSYPVRCVVRSLLRFLRRMEPGQPRPLSHEGHPSWPQRKGVTLRLRLVSFPTQADHCFK